MGIKDGHVGREVVIEKEELLVVIVILHHCGKGHFTSRSGGRRNGDMGRLRAIQYLPQGVALVVIDPGVGTNRKAIAVETAHPAKFPQAVEQATGQHPILPEFLSDLFEREERLTVLPNDLEKLQQEILSHR